MQVPMGILDLRVMLEVKRKVVIGEDELSELGKVLSEE